jgi:FkbM family methyltransferase
MTSNHKSEGSVRARGAIARLRPHISRVLPDVLRAPVRKLVTRMQSLRGAPFEVAGQRLRFLPNSMPTVRTASSSERDLIDIVQLEWFSAAIRTGDVVADIGAFRGTYTVIAAARAGAGGRVYAFEPTPANADVIAANLRLNRLQSRVSIERLAVSDQAGTARFFAWEDASTNALIMHHEEAVVSSVNTVTLDEFFQMRALPRIVKLDIEGGEVHALRGAQRLLASDALMICELHPYAWAAAGVTADELRDLLRAHDRYTADIITGAEVSDYNYGAVLLRKRS